MALGQTHRLCNRGSICQTRGLKILGGKALYVTKHPEDCRLELSDQVICSFQCSIFWVLSLGDPFSIFLMRDMSFFMRCSEVSGECPEKRNEYYVWYKSQVQTYLHSFWICDINGIIDLRSKVYTEWVEEIVPPKDITKLFHFSNWQGWDEFGQ